MRISDWSSDVCSSDLPDDTWVKTGGLWTKCVFVGPENCPDSPVGIAIKADGGVADYVAGKRSFGTTTMTVVLRGNVMHDGRWMSQGDMYKIGRASCRERVCQYV